jgi:transposase
MSNYSLFVGVDIAAKTATVSWVTSANDLSRAITIAQTQAGWQKLATQLRKQVSMPQECLIIMEVTGTYWMKMALFLYTAGFHLSVINPMQSRYFARLMAQKTKTDAVDAKLLAQLGMTLDVPLWVPPPDIFYELQQRLAYRDDLIAMRLQEKNRLHALKHQSTVVVSIQQRLDVHIQLLTEQIKQLDQEIESLLNSDHEWAESAHYLRSIPGVGSNTAAWILTTTLNFTVCTRPEEVVAFAGLAPHARHSGTSVQSKLAVGNGGHERLRRAVYLAALPASRFNPILAAFYRRLVERGKPKKVALCAVARKLLHIAWAVVTRKQYFDPNYGQQPLLARSSA